MANVKELKLRMRAHVEQRMRDVRESNCREFYEPIAYGAVWAASTMEAITDKERAAYLSELNQFKAAA
jgi:hypothetical protein